MQCHTVTCFTYYTKVPPHSLHQQEEKTGQYKAFALTGLGEFESQRLLSLGNKLLTGQMQLLIVRKRPRSKHHFLVPSSLEEGCPKPVLRSLGKDSKYKDVG